jgi:hypothetical protein
MKADKLFRNVPANIPELHLALAGLPKDMHVKADSEGISEKRRSLSFPSARLRHATLAGGMVSIRYIASGSKS